MAKKQVSKKEDDTKVFAFLATFLSIIGFIIAILTKKENSYVMFYAKQSLVVFIVSVIFWVINSVLVWIPVFGWIVAGILNLFVLILWIMSWVYALSGEKKEVPIVGRYAKSFNF